ncbi:hypothetical protein BH23CHL5_BH23CHL5_19510 [soil metagenome]
MFVYVGAYTESPMGIAKGIEIFRFDPDDGSLEATASVPGISNPSYLALHRGKDMVYAGERFLYAANELREGFVTALERDPESGGLTLLNSQTSFGADPCYVCVDGSGSCVLTANYSSGTIAAFPINPDGSLQPASSMIQHEGSSIKAGRQAGPHAHMIAPSPVAGFVLATDLGTDRVEIYTFDESDCSLKHHKSIEIEPGSGPRHFAFGKSGATLYVINELSSTVSVLDWDGGEGIATLRQTTSTLPADFSGESTCAHIVVSPDGRFVYGSNRGHDSIAIFSVHESTGALTPLGHQLTGGKEPRNFAIDPSGNWLLAANQHSDTIVTFRRDQVSGLLAETGILTATPTPVCVVFSE